MAQGLARFAVPLKALTPTNQNPPIATPKQENDLRTITRTVYLPFMSFSESLLTNNPVIFWSMVESAVGIIASAGATWRPLLRGDSVDSGSGSLGAGRYVGSEDGRFSGAGSRISRGSRVSRGRQLHRSGLEGCGGGRAKGPGLRSLMEEEEGILLDGAVRKGGPTFLAR